jgi:glycerol-3-phosphate dehydrogenase (NAD(P)+)
MKIRSISIRKERAMANVSVVGAGSFGVALATLLYKNGHKVTVKCSSKEKAEALNRERRLSTLADVELAEDILVTADMEEACRGQDMIVLATASVYIRSTARQMAPYIEPGQILVNVAKGIEEGTCKTLSEQIEEEIPQAQVAVLSGPSHAEEVGRGIPTTCVAGARKRAVAELVQSVFMCDSFRVYTNPDVLGMEIGGALKNVIALAAGIADGLGYGDNTKAALITRGMAEITRLAVAMGARQETMYGLSGIGDLVVTCASMHSRNRRAGILMGQGKTADEAMKEVNMVVEGVYAAKAGLTLAGMYHVSMPIVEHVNQILFEGKSPKTCMYDLMLRDRRVEDASLDWNE